MNTIASDILKANICREVMNLSREQLEAVSTYIESILSEGEKSEEFELPNELLQSVISYTCRTIEKEGPFFSTEEVFSKLDEEMKWK